MIAEDLVHILKLLPPTLEVYIGYEGVAAKVIDTEIEGDGIVLVGE